jgi:hypothetical protein
MLCLLRAELHCTFHTLKESSIQGQGSLSIIRIMVNCIARMNVVTSVGQDIPSFHFKETVPAFTIATACVRVCLPAPAHSTVGYLSAF